MKLLRGMYSKYGVYFRRKIVVIIFGGGKGYERNNSVRFSYNVVFVLYIGF